MELLCLATSSLDDPFAQEWHPDLRLTVNYLRGRGVDVEYRYVATPRETAELGDSAPTALFVDISEENRGPVLRFLARMHATWPDTTILVGGIPATLDGPTVLGANPWVDACICGERDVTLEEIVARLRSGRPFDDVPGVGVRGRPGAEHSRPLLPDLDVLGAIVRDGLADLVQRQSPPERVGHLVSSRGCPCRCTFCGVPDFYRQSEGRPWRGRSPVMVVDEMAAAAEAYGISAFVFVDDNFIGPGRGGQERARAIAAEILRRRLEVTFSICAPLSALRRDTLRELMSAGLTRLAISVESTDAASLRLLGRGHRPEHIDRALRMTESLGLACEINLMVFGPYATLDTVRDDLRLLSRVRESRLLSYSDAFPFNDLRAFPWSRVAGRLRREGLFDADADADGADAGAGTGASTGASTGAGTARCRFRDPRVARLVEFVAELESLTQLTFKYRPPVFGTEVDTGSGLMRVSAGVRAWVGLSLLPRYVGVACAVLDATGPDHHREALLDQLRVDFDADLNPVRALRGRTPSGG